MHSSIQKRKKIYEEFLVKIRRELIYKAGIYSYFFDIAFKKMKKTASRNREKMDQIETLGRVWSIW